MKSPHPLVISPGTDQQEPINIITFKQQWGRRTALVKVALEIYNDISDKRPIILTYHSKTGDIARLLVISPDPIVRMLARLCFLRKIGFNVKTEEAWHNYFIIEKTNS